MMNDIKALHNYVLVNPWKEHGKLWIPEDQSNPVSKGTVINLGPWANSPLLFENGGDMDFGPQLKIREELGTKVDSNRIQVGDIVYFPTTAAFKIEKGRETTFAIPADQLIAVERLDDIETE